VLTASQLKTSSIKFLWEWFLVGVVNKHCYSHRTIHYISRRHSSNNGRE